jgi:RHS repeat-associated protein
VAWTVNGVNDTATYSYLPNSDLLHQLTTNSGQLTTYSYEPNRNLKTQVENQFNSQLISQYDYTYNTLGLREHSDTGGQAFTGTPIEPTPETSTYMTNSLNQYTQITKNDGQQTTDTLTYDDDGNLSSIISSGATKVYKYNAENRLIGVEPTTPVNGDKKIEFVYDYMGRRVQKKVFTYTSNEWILSSDSRFVYEGWNLIQEQNSTGVVQKSYVWGLDLSQSVEGAGGVGGLLSVVDSGDVYNYFYDANGNVGQLIKASDGTISAHYEYDPFGILLKSYGSMVSDNPFRFSTKYYDEETDLYYYGYRYYSANLGRWISRDPIGEEGGLNLYAFVLNDPVNGLDIFGMWTKKGVLKILCCEYDRWVVDVLNNKIVYMFDKIIRKWKIYAKLPNGKKGKFLRDYQYEVGGLSGEAIWVQRSKSDKEAASSLFHEGWHSGKQKPETPLLDRENEAWIETQYFRQRHGINIRKDFLMKDPSDPTGKGMVIDVHAIKDFVKDEYDHRNPESKYIYEYEGQDVRGKKQITGWSCEGY